MFTSGFWYSSLNLAISAACVASWASVAPAARAFSRLWAAYLSAKSLEVPK